MSRPSARRPPGYRHRRRTNSAILLSLGFILSAIALGTGWWSQSTGTTTLYFTPGQTATCTGCAQPFYSYLTTVSAQMATLYAAVEYLVLGALLLAILAAVFAFLGAYGVTFGRGQLQLVVLFGVLAGILCAAPAVYAAIGQPAAFQAATNGACNGSPSYCSSFFYGSFTAGGSTTYYGPSVGWYAAIAGFLLLVVGAIYYSRTRLEPFTMDELAASRQMAGPGPMIPGAGPAMEPPWTAPPPPPQRAPFPGGAPLPAASSMTAVTCPRCGSLNAAAAPSCWRCQSALR